MPIDFKDEHNRATYTGRTADKSWEEAMLSVIRPNGLRIADVGCGGGIYANAWRGLGAAEVIGVDSSATMISAAMENCVDAVNISFQLGDAASTGLADESVDVVFARALIHHLTDTKPCFLEAMRILKSGGMMIVQDRTPEDVSAPGSPEHIRGYFFECFPRLRSVESARRRTGNTMISELHAAGFKDVKSMALWETRRVYVSKNELSEDIRQRKGRSILHELDDSELNSLTAYIRKRLPQRDEVIDKDKWTIWTALKPS